MSAYRFTRPRRAVTRVFIHCSASDNPAHDNVATMDQWHRQRGWAQVGYHLFIRKSGIVEEGRSLEKRPAAQDPHNTGTIAICLHGLKEELFTTPQKEALKALCIDINRAYGGKVTFHGHCEVSAKACPVIDYKALLRLDGKGRLGITEAAATPSLPPAPSGFEALEAPDHFGVMPVLRMGSKGHAVEMLQRQLAGLGYFPGDIDGKYGNRTRDAVLAFQADNDLIEDGICGRATWEVLDENPAPRPVSEKRAKKSVVGMAADGSRIAQASIGQTVTGSILTLGGLGGALEQSTGAVSTLAQSVGVYSGVVKSLGPWLGGLVVVAGLIVVLQAWRAARARRDDHRSGKTA